jgi:hypothetical protein
MLITLWTAVSVRGASGRRTFVSLLEAAPRRLELIKAKLRKNIEAVRGCARMHEVVGSCSKLFEAV